MKQVNVTQLVQDIMDFNKESDLHAFQGGVAEEIKKISITHDLELRKHTFSDGEVGGVCKKMIIEIDFGSSVIQPHTEFENGIVQSIVEDLANEVNGIFENSLDEQLSDEDDEEVGSA